MSKCDLAIVFDRPDRVYHSGETVRGHVEVNVDKTVKCNPLEIQMIWQTHGKGNRDKEILHTIREPNLEWEAGSTHRVPFSFETPKMPLSYHGSYLNIDYYIKARADIPWAIDPKVREEFILDSGETSERDYRAVQKIKETGALSGPLLALGWIVGIMALCGLIGLLLYYFYMFWYVFVGIGLLIGTVVLMKYMARKKLGQIKFEARDRIVVSGGAARIDVGIAPDKPVKINNITLTLTATEVCVSGSGTKRTTHTNTLREQQSVVVSDLQAQGGGIPLDFKHDIRIPHIGAYTFKSNNNSVSWELELHVDIPNYPDYKDRFELIVIPADKRRET